MTKRSMLRAQLGTRTIKDTVNAALMFLLDTSVLTRLRAPSIRQRIEELDAAGLARTSMTDLEIGA